MGGMTLQDKLFSFRGRVTRQDYWVYHLVLWGLLGPLAVFVFGWSEEGRTGEAHWWSSAMIAFSLLCVVQIWPSVAINVKRCHDRGKSGWWMLLWAILSPVPYLGLLSGLWYLVELGFLDGTQGANRFGPSPKGLSSDQISEAFT
ncbi:DUF805 domain-containing protein [Labrys wisconsinensis]|uniref:Uncharacterized membrane protein YhaH (DUF805 family) n=1 Tax=Labrys wisconsinensis TaxID=425677 RepID=A0ABU0J7R2_9HYPH|nr:DUF805 domain-containing protein [Labrys wisconsinensis]MDQ0470313.1 uncharacterized membrane protein YhaH (DUF805 family) [Labrys wisconsinensis]